METPTPTTKTAAELLINAYDLSRIRAEDIFEGQHVLVLKRDGFRFGKVYEDTAHMTGSTHVHLNMSGESLTTRKYSETSRTYSEPEYDEPEFTEHNTNALYYGTRF